MSYNKVYQQHSETADERQGFTDQVGVETRNNTGCYVNETPIYTPSSPVLFSPDYDYERATQNQKISTETCDEISGSSDWRHNSRLLSTCSPTSSQSGNSELFIANDQLSKKTIQEIQLAKTQDTQRLSANFSSEPSFNPEIFSNESKKEIQEFLHFTVQSPNHFPRRTPGFPKACFTT